MTELIIFHRPTNGSIKENLINPDSSILARGVNNTLSGGTAEPSSQNPKAYYLINNNANKAVTPVDIGLIRPNAQGDQGLRVDLYEDIPLPINYTIADIREPDKRKTSWSKTITIPGTKSNNRIFNHIYELDRDNWMTIGSQSYWSGFNPNLRKEVLLVQDGVQVFKGNLQLKSAKKFYDGNVEYEIIINGDLTSLFYDIGNAKLSDLDYKIWEHDFNKTNLTNSWFGVCKYGNSTYNSITNVSPVSVSKLDRDATTGRTVVTSTTAHTYKELDFVLLTYNASAVGSANMEAYQCIFGVYTIAKIIGSYSFQLNYEYPLGLLAIGTSSIPANHLSVFKQEATGQGYVYPMCSWGDEYDQNSFPVKSFAPAVYVKGIFDNIMKLTSSEYDSAFINSEFFKRLIIIEKRGQYDQPVDEINTRAFRVGTMYDYTTLATDLFSTNSIYSSQLFTKNWNWLQSTSTASNAQASDQAPKLNFSKETGGGVGSGALFDGIYRGVVGNVSNWNQDTATWIVPASGEYDLTANVTFTCWADMIAYDGATSSTFSPTTKNYYPKVNTGLVGMVSAPPLGQGAIGIAVQVILYRKRNGVKSFLGQTIQGFPTNTLQVWDYTKTANTGWDYFGRYSPQSWKNITVTVNSADRFFKEGDEVWAEAQYFIQANAASAVGGVVQKRAMLFTEETGNASQPWQDISANVYVKIVSPSIIYCQPSAKIVEGSRMTENNLLPKDMSCADFLRGLIKMFNLHIQPDPNKEKKYIIEPREDFYYDGVAPDDFVDWSDKIDYNSIKITPMGELGAKTYIFENKDENDYWNTKFKEERGRPYMQYTKTIENDFLKNEYKITLPFGSTVMINNPESSDVVMPAVHQREATGAMKPLQSSAPRILLYVGPRPYTAQGKMMSVNSTLPVTKKGWEFLSSLESVKAFAQLPYGSQLLENGAIAASASYCHFYPYAGTVDSPNEPFYDINWYNQEAGDFVYWDSARWTTHNLYNAYWKNFINEISDPASLLVEAEFRLNASDVAALDFRKIYVVDGIWYRLQKVSDYDAIGRTPTKCELLKIKAPTKFVRASNFQGAQLGEVEYLDRQLSYSEVSIAPPKRKFISEGYANKINSASLSNATVNVNGKGNFVGQSNNVKINGNENVVGNGSENIHITSGSGNFISGGLKNVTVIGTDKRVIRESDVSYINGIRYKNGVPISRVNVIDGGSTSANTPASSNTIANVIEGGEDVVINRGSQSYEDVIDAGSDLILPDIAELGLSSTATPFPRTSFAGGFDAKLAVGETARESIIQARIYSS